MKRKFSPFEGHLTDNRLDALKVLRPDVRQPGRHLPPDKTAEDGFMKRLMCLFNFIDRN